MVLYIKNHNYTGMLIGLPLVIPCFLTLKITAEGAEERNAHSPLRVPPHTLWLNSRLVHVVFRVTQCRYSKVA